MIIPLGTFTTGNILIICTFFYYVPKKNSVQLSKLSLILCQRKCDVKKHRFNIQNYLTAIVNCNYYQPCEIPRDKCCYKNVITFTGLQTFAYLLKNLTIRSNMGVFNIFLYFYRVSLHLTNKETSATVEHCNGNVVVSASTQEIAISRHLYS